MRFCETSFFARFACARATQRTHLRCVRARADRSSRRVRIVSETARRRMRDHRPDFASHKPECAKVRELPDARSRFGSSPRAVVGRIRTSPTSPRASFGRVVRRTARRHHARSNIASTSGSATSRCRRRSAHPGGRRSVACAPNGARRSIRIGRCPAGKRRTDHQCPASRGHRAPKRRSGPARRAALRAERSCEMVRRKRPGQDVATEIRRRASADGYRSIGIDPVNPCRRIHAGKSLRVHSSRRIHPGETGPARRGSPGRNHQVEALRTSIVERRDGAGVTPLRRSSVATLDAGPCSGRRKSGDTGGIGFEIGIGIGIETEGPETRRPPRGRSSWNRSARFVPVSARRLRAVRRSRPDPAAR